MFRMPKVSGRDLDLYLLYSKVVALGGVVKVRKKEKKMTKALSRMRDCVPLCVQLVGVGMHVETVWLWEGIELSEEVCE